MASISFCFALSSLTTVRNSLYIFSCFCWWLFLMPRFLLVIRMRGYWSSEDNSLLWLRRPRAFFCKWIISPSLVLPLRTSILGTDKQMCIDMGTIWARKDRTVIIVALCFGRFSQSTFPQKKWYSRCVHMDKLNKTHNHLYQFLN